LGGRKDGKVVFRGKKVETSPPLTLAGSQEKEKKRLCPAPDRVLLRKDVDQEGAVKKKRK